MKVYGFLKLLNKKIKKYESVVSNPFEHHNIPITLIWVEDKKDFDEKYEL